MVISKLPFSSTSTVPRRFHSGGMPGGRIASRSLFVGVPQLDGGAVQAVALEVGDLALEDQRRRDLVLLAHRHRALGRELGAVRDVVGAFDGAWCR